MEFLWGYDLDEYYDLLGRGFAGGHLYLPVQPSPELLAQPDPWDPAVDRSLKRQDLVLFGGHYYLYFGAAPAVLLFTPFRLITGHDLPQGFAMFLLCFGGFLFSCGALLRVLDLAAMKPGPFPLAVMLLALGICQSVPYLLNRADVYETAIGGGYFCVSAALFFFARGFRSRRGAAWFAGCGLMLGLAVASRPHLFLAGVATLAGLAILLGRPWRLGAVLRSREFVALVVSLALVGAAIAAYNYERFGNPFEFGFRYQLAGKGQNRIELAPRNLVPGLYFMLLAKPEFSPVFPWIRRVFRFPFDSAERHPLPPEYFIEPTVGALWVAPFIVAALFLPSRRLLARHSDRAAPAEVRTVLGVALCSAVAVLLFLMFTHLATHRYEVDFLPLAVFAAVATLGIRIGASSGRRRVALSALFVVLIGYSAIANLALGIAGPYDDILKNRPLTYVRIARWFSPLRETRLVTNPEIAVDLIAEFIPEPPGFREPLITIGQTRYHHFLFVEHGAGVLRLISQTDDSTMMHEMPDPGRQPVSIRLVYSPESRKLSVRLNGQEVIVHPAGMLITAPALVAIGENSVDPGLTVRRFTGRLRLIDKTVRGFR
ncbi:MAG: hypothetical protein LAQ69_34480 [Acidobacteriia bacterium]|nr:hypothetical protein [Terriglobia bacterium]